MQHLLFGNWKNLESWRTKVIKKVLKKKMNTWYLATKKNFFGSYQYKQDCVEAAQNIGETDQKPTRIQEGFYQLKDLYIIHERHLKTQGFEWILDRRKKSENPPTIKRKTKQQKEAEKQQAIAAAQEKFFGGITKEEALEIFKALALLAQFPGAKPPEPINRCEVIWQSTMKVGDSLDKQVFSVQVSYKGLMFIYTFNKERAIQLPDSGFMNMDSWDYQELLLTNRVLEGIK